MESKHQIAALGTHNIAEAAHSSVVVALLRLLYTVEVEKLRVRFCLKKRKHESAEVGKGM